MPHECRRCGRRAWINGHGEGCPVGVLRLWWEITRSPVAMLLALAADQPVPGA